MLKKCILSLILLNLLTGCEMMNSSYDCPLEQGASCISLHDMDRAVSQGLYPKRTHLADSNSTYVVHRDLVPGSYPMRTKDKVAKIWLAPYEDVNGNYHEQSNIYTVIANSTWVGTPVKASKLKGKA